MPIHPITLEKLSRVSRPIQAELDEALVRELLLRTKGAGLALIGAAVLYWVIVRSFAGPAVSVLVGGLVVLAIGRTLGTIWVERHAVQPFPFMAVFRGFQGVTAAIGLSIGGMIVVSFPDLPPFRVALASLLVLAMCFGAMISLAASPPVFLSYVVPSIGALAYVGFAYPQPGAAHTFQATYLVFSMSLLVMSRSVHLSLRRHIELRLQLAESLAALQDTQAQLVEASRLAGRADVATAVIHNVGNVLNSVNVSATLVVEAIEGWKSAGLVRVAALLMEHQADLGGFLRDDPRGGKLITYLTEFVEVIEHNKRGVAAELQSLIRNIEHIRAIVRSQAVEVRDNAVAEPCQIEVLLEDAIAFCLAGSPAIPLEVARDLSPMPPVVLDRHKTLQIVMNLLANARDAVVDNAAGDRRITVRAGRAASGALEIAIEDNGCGIAPEHLDRIFALRFTTKPHGHGLGLHYSACAAGELGGVLTANSPGVGRGAVFRLVLPASPLCASRTGRSSTRPHAAAGRSDDGV